VEVVDDRWMIESLDDDRNVDRFEDPGIAPLTSQMLRRKQSYLSLNTWIFCRFYLDFESIRHGLGKVGRHCPLGDDRNVDRIEDPGIAPLHPKC
jgi:hypothetical protein